LGAIPFSTKIAFTRDIILAGDAIDAGVVASTTWTREKYWKAWCSYANSVNINPLLTDTIPIIRDMVLTAFAARVRQGYYGNGNTIKVQSVTDAMAAISKTIELAGYRSPVYRADNKYNLSIERAVEGWRRDDPLAIPQLAVPVTVPLQMAEEAYLTGTALHQTIADLALLGFFYLLRVGEYTRPRVVTRNGKTVSATRTKQFRVKDVGFFKNGVILPRRSRLDILITADQGTLKITYQKNGRMGETITHETVKDAVHGPVTALARRVHHILSNGGTEDSLLSDYINEAGVWNTVTSTQMRQGVRTSVKTLKLDKNGIDPDLVGVHSLRAGGAMALKLQGVSDTIIQKQGRWTSMTFLQYIHNQIAHLSKSLSTKMSTQLLFQNIANIEKIPTR
jgi:hypothetical protein